MPRFWVWISASLLLVLSVGCDELDSKPNAKQQTPDVGQKSVDHMRGMSGVAPPEGLQ
ncbi:MAG: hypothetical protein P4L84_01380 [Isosphaeraceae bacterium]|nr:hypothetical protein [Isosphaeraceae bacterium]